MFMRCFDSRQLILILILILIRALFESVCGISSYQKDEDVDIQATQAHRSHEIIEIDEPCAKRILVKAHRSTVSF